MKKILSLVLCLLFCVGVFAGCGLKEGEKGANISVFLSDYPYTLDPAVIQLNSDVEQILNLIYEPLTTIDEDGEVQPALATDWYYEYDEIYQEHKMYFELKVTSWSDDRQVSADDVIYAWRRILSPETDSPYASLLYAIKGARDVKSGVGTIDDLGLAAEDDTLLAVTFENKYDADLFAEQVANIHLAPCREDIVTRYEKQGKDWAASAATIVCNGKFRVQSMDMPRQTEANEDKVKSACRLVLERNSFYLREEDEDLDKYVEPYRITCYYYEGLTDYYQTGLTQEKFQYNRLTSGEIFYLSAFDKDTYAAAKNSDYEFETVQTLNGYAFYYNTAKIDKSARQALSNALDRNAIVAATGTGEVAATGYVPSGVFNTKAETDFRKEGGALYQNGVVNGKVSGEYTLIYLIPQNSYTIKNYQTVVDYNTANIYKTVAEQAAAQWKALGVKITCKGLTPDAYLEALKTRDYDIIGVNIVNSSTDAFSYLAPFAKEYSGAGLTAEELEESTLADDEVFKTHYTNFDNANYSALIDKALASSDRGERANALHEAEKMLVDESPATMVFWYSYSYAARDEIDDYEINNIFGFIDFTELELDDWRDVNAKEESILAERG